MEQNDRQDKTTERTKKRTDKTAKSQMDRQADRDRARCKTDRTKTLDSKGRYMTRDKKKHRRDKGQKDRWTKQTE